MKVAGNMDEDRRNGSVDQHRRLDYFTTQVLSSRVTVRLRDTPGGGRGLSGVHGFRKHALGQLHREDSEETQRDDVDWQHGERHDGRHRPVENGPGYAPRPDISQGDEEEFAGERRKWSGRPERVR